MQVEPPMCYDSSGSGCPGDSEVDYDPTFGSVPPGDRDAAFRLVPGLAMLGSHKGLS